jgi:N-methylhydantoinase B
MSDIDPITLQVVAGALRGMCEEMGAVLVRSAYSANIKERRDCSTALFDADGEMVMQAEHIPVHLGAMPAAVAAVLERERRPRGPWILNDPFAGGTHLPDITVVCPVWSPDQRLLGFAASRAHHADVGGKLPGSMPADSTRLEEEGVIIPPSPLGPELIEQLVARMRQPHERRADLRGTRTAEDVLEAPEGDLVLRLRATVRDDELELDFGGSAPQHEGNLNCPLAVTVSACLFALRVLTDPDIPASAGVTRPLHVRAAEGSLLAARAPAAVVGGNVETSSRVADLVLEAFGRALGQGTMNNLTLGNERFTYYETLGGGQGACPDADGPAAVHVAMSNTLNTPVEALEREFPLRVREYAVRRESGGAGRFHGGDGVVRELEALEPMQFSLITERRRHPPRGAAGGAAGRAGRNLLDGEELPSKLSGTLRPGARLRIETPGGGGHGPPRAR